MTTTPLGRGLGSLIPMQVLQDQQAIDPHAPIHRLPVTRIRANPKQPRSTISHDTLEELIESVKEHGILQPLVVTSKGRDYEIIAGERRYQAAKIAGLKTVPVIIRDVGEQEQLELALVENLQRQDLNPLEEAGAYQRLLDEFNLTQEQIAKRVGKSRSYVANTVRLRLLPPEVKKAIADGKITEGHAKVLLSLATPEEQLVVLANILRHGLTVRASEGIVQKSRSPRPGRKRSSTNPEQLALEDLLRQRLGTKVQIHKSGEHGTIVIEFFSLEELHSLVQQLTKNTQ